jgi:hypothetical protein
MARHSIPFSAGSSAEDSVEITIPLVLVQGGQRKSVVLGDRLQKVGKLFRKGGREPLARVSFLPFGIFDLNGHGLEVNAAKGDASLVEATSQVDEQLKSHCHPSSISFFFGKGSPRGLDVLVGKFALLFRGSNLNAVNRNHIPIAKLSSDGLVDEEGEKFKLHSGGIVAGISSNGGFPPSEVFLSMPVMDVAGVNKAVLVKKDMEGSPKVYASSAGFDVGVVTGDEVVHPTGKPLPFDWNNQSFLLGFLRCELECFRRVLRAVRSQLSVLFLPLAAVEVSVAKVMVRGAFDFYQIGHEEHFHTLPHITRYLSHSKSV